MNEHEHTPEQMNIIATELRGTVGSALGDVEPLDTTQHREVFLPQSELPHVLQFTYREKLGYDTRRECEALVVRAAAVVDDSRGASHSDRVYVFWGDGAMSTLDLYDMDVFYRPESSTQDEKRRFTDGELYDNVRSAFLSVAATKD